MKEAFGMLCMLIEFNKIECMHFVLIMRRGVWIGKTQ